MGLLPIFPESDDMNIYSLLFMMAVYGYILMNASKTISDGCEMLLLMYGSGIIGSLLLPLLGAVPDCAVILISGLGSGTQEEIQQQLSVGVGTLVGSTVMLLTVPWAIGIYMGRRDYDPITHSATIPAPKQPKVTHFSLFTNCVAVLDDIPGTSKIMMLTTISYLIIQIPAFFYKHTKDGGVSEERPYALTGVIITLTAFMAYCYFQYSSAQAAEITRLQQEAARKEQWKKSLDHRLHYDTHQELIFHSHDKDHSGYIEAEEFSKALASLGLKVGRRDVITLLSSIDLNNDGKISLHEFKTAVNHWIARGQNADELTQLAHKKALSRQLSRQNSVGKVLVSATVNGDNTNNSSSVTPLIQASNGQSYGSNENKSNIQIDGVLGGVENEDEENEEEEEEEEEEEFWHLSDKQLKFKAIGLLLLGTAICTIISDPMVDTITELGNRMNMSPFYISFVVTPLASNASEVIAGLVFAKKKTTDSISLTLATLHGAACMNNTLALCIFMSLVYFRQLSWSFSAEVLAVVLVVLIVGFNGLNKTILLWQAVLVGSLYPASILFVYILENFAGLD